MSALAFADADARNCDKWNTAARRTPASLLRRLI
jgi:hypothetical protein